jgi:hypothetical protein
MSDISPKALRGLAAEAASGANQACTVCVNALYQAATAIERQAMEIERLKRAIADVEEAGAPPDYPECDAVECEHHPHADRPLDDREDGVECPRYRPEAEGSWPRRIAAGGVCDDWANEADWSCAMWTP